MCCEFLLGARSRGSDYVGVKEDDPYFYLIVGNRVPCRTQEEMLFLLSFEKYWISVQKYGTGNGNP